MLRMGAFRVAALATTVAAAGVPALAAGPAAAQAEPDNVWLTERSGANIAHAGGLHEAPQNTLFAFETASDRGADVIEIDLQITSDGHVVAMHDSTVDRTTSGQGCVVEHTLAEIQQLDAADNHVQGEGPVDGLDPDTYPYRGIATGEAAPPDGFEAGDFTVPTLESIFQALPDTVMVVEIKPQEVETAGGVRHDCPAALEAIPEAERPDIVAELARLIDEYGMADRIMVASFIDDLMHRFTAAAPDVDTSFPLQEGLAFYSAFQQGTTPPNPHGHEAIQAPVSIAGIEASAEFVAYARQHGVAIHFWTINDPAEMNQLLDWGADGLITDRPQVLADVFAEREETPPVEPDPGWQSPFLCTTEFQGLGQPIVDNQERRGTPVYPENADGTPDRAAEPIGWSEACQVEPVVEYRYRTTGGALQALPPDATALPDDIAYLDVDELVGVEEMELAGAEEIPYLIRFERGTLPQNRFLYSIAMLAPWEEVASGAGAAGDYSEDHWNGRLLFSFGGGVGIGHSQGELSTGGGTVAEAMRLGHAVLYTSGTRTSTHYNLLVGGRTAVEAKALVADQHGEPRYTVGIGGSGGGIQQYVYAQNHPDLLDALIPQYAYPDMTTQTIHIGDCELLEHYMDVTDAANPRWSDWDQRQVVEGLNSIEGFTSSWQERMGSTGSSECIEGWRGSTPLAMNPTFGFSPGMEDVIPLYLGEILTSGYPADFPDLGRLLRTHEDPEQWVDWTHWDDAREAYGTDPATGLAEVPWDNVGVQYGLRAVAGGALTPEEFLDLNARVGSWNEPEEAVLESCALAAAIGGDELATIGRAIGMCEGDEPDWYSSRQMTVSTDPDQPAPRRSADIDAIRGAFETGLVFDGTLPADIPIIDARHYLEHELDMHNSHQSFAIRERIRAAQGHVDNHAIWFLDARPEEDPAATSQLFEEGFRVIDEWVLAIEAHPTGDVGASRPAAAADTCWDTDGTLLARGDDVWSGAVELIETGRGAWDGAAPTEVEGVPVGDCAARFPLHSTSRIVAGGPVTGDVYKCHTMPVAEAVADGLYGSWAPTPDEQARLEAIFPNGVCDYSQPSVGDPSSPSFVARFSDRECALLDRFVDLLGFDDVQAMIRAGVRLYEALADAGRASPVETPPGNDGPCEFVIGWPDGELDAGAVADAWGVDVDELHHGGGLIFPAIVYVLAVEAASSSAWAPTR
jgi:glycerophosphoryl diester phosphodiesterase